MKYLKVSRRNGKETVFLKYGGWTINQSSDPISVTKEEVTEMVASITNPDLRRMYGSDGESLTINMAPHSAAKLSNECNEDIIQLQELAVDWEMLEIRVAHQWTVHVRLNPPLVETTLNF